MRADKILPMFPFSALNSGAKTNKSGNITINSKFLSRTDPARVLSKAHIAKNPIDSFSILLA